KSLQSALDKAEKEAPPASSGSSGSGGASGASGSDGAGKQQGGGAKALENGTFTGDAEKTQYGTVQVRITVAGGKITRAEAVQAPKGGQSDQVTFNSVPRLNKAVVEAGSADIDAVSGATYTS
ncbi:FMN-binding protein, partial [Streptomyces sp. SID9913]